MDLPSPFRNFTLHGGPLNGSTVPVSGDHKTGESVHFSHVVNGVQYVYVCPSDEDFDNGDLWLSLEPVNAPLHSVEEHAALNRWLQDGSYYKNTYVHKKPLVNKIKRLIELDWEQHQPSMHASTKAGVATKKKKTY